LVLMKSHAIEHSIGSGMRKCLIKSGDRRMFAKIFQRLFISGFQVVAHLSKDLHQKFGFLMLFIEVGRKSFHIIIAILIMTKTKLTNAAIINDTSISQYIISIPIKPGKNIIDIERGCELGKCF